MHWSGPCAHPHPVSGRRGATQVLPTFPFFLRGLAEEEVNLCPRQELCAKLLIQSAHGHHADPLLPPHHLRPTGTSAAIPSAETLEGWPDIPSAALNTQENLGTPTTMSLSPHPLGKWHVPHIREKTRKNIPGRKTSPARALLGKACNIQSHSET